MAGALFTFAERRFNKELKISLENILNSKKIANEIFLPQEYAHKISNEPKFFDLMFDYCIQKIEESTVILAMLEGADADSGTCIELGYAYANHKFIVGLRTDIRPSEFKGLNLMVSKVCNELILLKDHDMNVDSMAQRIFHYLKG